MAASEEILFALSTHVVAPKKFTVDGEEFNLLSLDHLSKEEEAMVMALFARHALLGQELELSPNAKRGAEVAERLRNCRLQLLTRLTTMSKSVAESLPLSEQARLLSALEEEMALVESDEEEDKSVERAEGAPVAAKDAPRDEPDF